MTQSKNFQTLAWFNDLYRRQLLDLDPPYQRKSVWNQDYKDYFIDTILLGYPAPTVFLFQEISPEGLPTYSVVDGKQRLTTIFEFAGGQFPVGQKATISRLRGKYFKDLDSDEKQAFWSYTLTVETLPSSDEEIINNIFDRINRNVARLTRQELRHAKFDGEFIRDAEAMSFAMAAALPANVPQIAQQSRKQMKDVEFTAQLLLLLERGTQSESQDDLDAAFSDRETDWAERDRVNVQFQRVLQTVAQLFEHSSQTQNALKYSRLRNQADFYSLFGAISELLEEKGTLEVEVASLRLQEWLLEFRDQPLLSDSPSVKRYYEAARSASNDVGQRRARINILKSVIAGEEKTEAIA